MLQSEFESLIGKRVDFVEYDTANKVYMDAEAMDKQEFCKAWKGLKEPQRSLVIALQSNCSTQTIKRQQAEHDLEMALTEKESLRDEVYNLRDENKQLSDDINDRRKREGLYVATMLKAGLDKEVASIVGLKKTISAKIALGLDLSDDDKTFILSEFNK